MRPSAETPRSRRRRHTTSPTETSKEHHESEAASIEAGLKLLEVYTAALKELRERGQDTAGDVNVALNFRHAPRDWSNAEILSIMADVIDEHPRPKLEFVLGVLGLSKVPDNLDERLRSKGAKAYASSVRNRALRRKKEAKEKEERERREKKEREERAKREKREREEKERLERERLEKERREHERREYERREQQRVEKERLEKEKLEKEKLEKERMEKEKAEAEKAALIEAEAKRGRGKGRRGRRGRPTTRVVATERSKKIGADQPVGAAKVLAQGSQEQVQSTDAMVMDADGAGGVTKPMSDTDPIAEAMQKVAISDGRSAATAHVTSTGNDISTMPASSLPQPPPSEREANIVGQNAKSAQSTEQPVTGTSKHEQPPLTYVGKSEPEMSSSLEQKEDQTKIEAKKMAQAGWSVGKADLLQKKPTVNAETPEQLKASHVKQRLEEPTMEIDAKPEVRRQGVKKAYEPVLPLATIGEGRRISREEPQYPTDAPVVPPKVIAEAKIASALKESAAAVNGEKSAIRLDRPVSTKVVADVGEISGIAQLQGRDEKEAADSVETIDQKRSVIAQQKSTAAANEVGATPGDAIAIHKTAREPVQQEPTAQAQEGVPSEAKTGDEKNKIIDSSGKPIGEPKAQETGPGATVTEPKGEKATEINKEEEKQETKLTDVSQKPLATSIGKTESEDMDDEAKPDDKTKEADTEEKPRESEQEAEDFMADVFGPEDGDGEKDDTEEGDVTKRAHRYRSRGRNYEEEDMDAVTTDKGLKMEESEEESQAKYKQKRGRAIGGARRMSRRVSNIRDEIVIAPSGRRMRRESRNLIGAWQLPNPDKYLIECVDVWERLHRNRITIPFREPVAAKDAPGYFDVVKNPMDMGTVKNMLQDGRISSPDEFYKQMKLICSNSLLFNDEDSDLYELALELLGMVKKETKPIVAAWREAKGLDPEESESESEVETQRKRTKSRSKKKTSKSKSKAKSKSTVEKRKRVREDDGGGKSKKRRTLRRSARREEEE